MNDEELSTLDAVVALLSRLGPDERRRVVPDAALPIDKIRVYRPPGTSPGEALRRLVGR